MKNIRILAVAAAIAAQFSLPAMAQEQQPLATIKQVDAGVLNVGYVDAGPADGPVVILLHGWPYDIHSYVDVVPLLTKAGYRVIVPHLRGYGSTRFLDAKAVRNGEPAALAADVVALMDALKIDKAVLAGYDRCRQAPNCNGGTSSTSPPNAARPATKRTATISPS